MRTAIVTGASGNLGQAVIKKFLAEGLTVIGTTTGKHDLPFSNDPKFEAMIVDLTNEEDPKKFATAVIEKYKTIDVAVLTVGGFAPGKIAETSIADIKKQYKLNFETTYNIAVPVFVQMMKQDSGRIFLTGARTGSDMKFSKSSVAYGLSKSLIFRLAELMNEEAKGNNVVTTIISPSTIDTPQNRESMPDADFTRWVRPEDIAAIIYSYCTPAASVIREPVIKVYNNS